MHSQPTGLGMFVRRQVIDAPLLFINRETTLFYLGFMLVGSILLKEYVHWCGFSTCFKLIVIAKGFKWLVRERRRAPKRLHEK